VSTTAIVWIPRAAAPPEPIDPRLLRLRQMVLDAVTSPNSKRNYAKALDDLFVFAAGRPLSRALLMEWRAAMDKLSPSTVNVRLSAMRKVISEAQRNGMLSAGEAENLTGVPNLPQKGTRLGNWLTREQAKFTRPLDRRNLAVMIEAFNRLTGVNVSVQQVITEAETTSRSYLDIWLETAGSQTLRPSVAELLVHMAGAANDPALIKTALDGILTVIAKELAGPDGDPDLEEDIAAWREISRDISSHLGNTKRQNTCA
jgi:hypothetical protein